ncbi:hypothetical protein QF032_000085 [Streptomyces achromogenes]|nr:hypothetical protein [Streptomyces achromogenes]
MVFSAATAAPGSPGGLAGGTPRRVSSASIVVHPPSSTGGRRVSVHWRGRDETLGAAFSDHDLVVFLEGAGVQNPDSILDDDRWIEWRGGRARQWSAV